MPFSVRYHLRGNKTDNPVHLRTMALQFADQMLKPPVYPPLRGDGVREEASNRLAEHRSHFDREQHFQKDLSRTKAPDKTQRVIQWIEDVERARGVRPRTQENVQRHGDKDAAKKASAKMSKARDNLQESLKSMRPTVEVIRERHAALLERL